MAYTQEEIQNILNGIITAFKKADNNYAANAIQAIVNPGVPIPTSRWPRIPDYYPAYHMLADWYERLRIHSEQGYFPDKLFAKRSPNQTQQEADYIRENYKQVTLPFFLDYVSTVTRAFADPNQGVDYMEDDEKYKNAGKTFQQYVESEIKDYGSIANFIQNVIPTLKAKDANGIIAIKPNQFYTTTDPLTGELIVDETQLNTPVPFYFSSLQVVQYEEGEFCMVELVEKSVVTYGSAQYRIGKIYEFYDEENIWRITQTGRFIDYQFTIEVYYNHNWGKVPVTRLKGIPQILNNEIIWISPMLYVTDLLDLVILNHSNLQVSINTCVYPYRIMYGDACDFRGPNNEEQVMCNGGQLLNLQGMPVGRVCPQCDGSGLKSRISPMGVMLLKPPDRDGENEGKLSQKAMEYVSPNPDILKYLQQKIQEDYSKAQQILHLKADNPGVRPQGTLERAAGITATEVVSNQKALYAFVRSVSDQTFDIYQFILDAIGWMRYGQDYEQATVKYPNTFDFANEMDYIIQLGEAAKYNLPPYVLYSIIDNYLKSLYQDDKDSADAFKLIVQSDRLLTLNNADIVMKLNLGTIEKWEEILHTSAPTFVMELDRDFQPQGTQGQDDFIEDFFDLPLIEQQKQLVAKAKAKANEIKTDSPAVMRQQAASFILNKPQPKVAA